MRPDSREGDLNTTPPKREALERVHSTNKKIVKQAYIFLESGKKHSQKKKYNETVAEPRFPLKQFLSASENEEDMVIERYSMLLRQSINSASF